MFPFETEKEKAEPSTRKPGYLLLVAKAVSAYRHNSEHACADNLERTLKQRCIGDTASIYKHVTEEHNNWKLAALAEHGTKSVHRHEQKDLYQTQKGV